VAILQKELRAKAEEAARTQRELTAASTAREADAKEKARLASRADEAALEAAKLSAQVEALQKDLERGVREPANSARPMGAVHRIENLVAPP
jgi:chromosome segregation ATPase